MLRTAVTPEAFSEYEAAIGIEVHVQLNTASKIFCPCANRVAKKPNSQICAVCAGHPGTLPVLNECVLDAALMLGIATHSRIAPCTTFARKHYFYPDLPKNYQITQADRPICSEGFVEILSSGGDPKKVRLIRIHLEEDAGKNIHSSHSNESFVDLNRAGAPLLEIVSYPDITTADEARAYLKALHELVVYLKISTGNMEEGAFRADVNISVRKKGATALGTKCELKNINSFKFITDAIEYEISRQIALIEEGGRVRQETRLWDTKNKTTLVMRSKEVAADYRYLQDPDLPFLTISDVWVERIRAQIPELPRQKFERLQRTYALAPYEAEILIEDQELATYYEAVRVHTHSASAINWLLRDFRALLKEQNIVASESRVNPEQFAGLMNLIESGVITNRTAQVVLQQIMESGKDPLSYITEHGLQRVGSNDEVEALVAQVVRDNANAHAEYRAGKVKLFGFFVGLVMKKLGGKGDPRLINELLRKHLQ